MDVHGQGYELIKPHLRHVIEVVVALVKILQPYFSPAGGVIKALMPVEIGPIYFSPFKAEGAFVRRRYLPYLPKRLQAFKVIFKLQICLYPVFLEYIHHL